MGSQLMFPEPDSENTKSVGTRFKLSMGANVLAKSTNTVIDLHVTTIKESTGKRSE